ncbi:hypothetical protein CTEN210_09790 [Chaetoceros tenuissimus]|uniref:F-box domain-containing protein n=1 Tax=Chaetoceros tenuissimus TaxID=426638 RepID=A0AAD3H802_9STRA|nr:hypothetical protein CTEN210_09790 [Chaetoceros tenuissimus]
MTPARKRMRLEDGSSSDGMLLEPSATMNDLPNEVMKNIFSFIGKGNYYFIGQVSKDFCFDYLTMDVIEDKFAHKMDYLQAIGKNRVTSTEAVVSSFDLAEYCFFKAPVVFQKRVVRKAAVKGRKDIVEMGHAMGMELEKLVNSGSRSGESNLFKIARRGDLEMLQFLQEKGVNMKPNRYNIIRAAAESNQLKILKWAHEKKWCSSPKGQDIIFTIAAKRGQIPVLKWAMDVAGFVPLSDSFNYVAASGNLDVIKYLRSKELMSWDEVTFRNAACSGNIALLQHLLENDCPRDDPMICVKAIENDDNEKSLEVLQWLHRKGFPWDENTCTTIAKKGNLKALKYARLNGCPWNEECLKRAVESFHLELVEYCLTNGCAIGSRAICHFAMLDSNHARALKMLKLLRNFSIPWNPETCSLAAKAGNFEAFKYAVSNGCPVHRQWCANLAAAQGNIEVMKLIRAQGAVFEEQTCVYAAMGGRLDTLKWLRSIGTPLGKWTFSKAKTSAIFEYCIENDVPCDDHIYKCAIKVLSDPIPIIKLLRNSGYPWHQSACAEIVTNGDLKLLRWLRFNGFPWDESVCIQAVNNNNLEILKYVHENGCEWTKETYAHCFSEDGLDLMYDEIPSDEDARSAEILNYLKEHDCPQPDFHDWILRGYE